MRALAFMAIVKMNISKHQSQKNYKDSNCRSFDSYKKMIMTKNNLSNETSSTALLDSESQNLTTTTRGENITASTCEDISETNDNNINKHQFNNDIQRYIKT